MPVAAPAPAAERLLDQLEAAAADHRTLSARVRMRSIQDLLDDETARFGDLAWSRADPAANTPTRFAIAFDRLKPLDGPLEKVQRHYIYDGRWLLDTDGQARTATRRELRGANGEGDLAFGDGPFLVPLNLKKKRVLEKFAATLAGPDAETDPEDTLTDHLVLVPRTPDEIDAVRLDLWFDQATGLPRRVASTQSDGDQTIIDLFEITVNPLLPADSFNTALPTTPGWELQTVSLQSTP